MNSIASSTSSEIFRVGGLSSSSSLSFIARHFDCGLIVFPSESQLHLEDAKNALEFFLQTEQKSAICLKFPELPTGYTSVGGDPEDHFTRVQTQYRLAKSESKKIFVLTTGIALSQKLLSPKHILESPLVIKKGDWLERNQILSELARLGFRKDELAEDHGFFSLRGHLIDVYPMDNLLPYRIEFFGDEVISIREFDPESQRSLEEKNEIMLFPLQEIMISEKNRESARQRLKDLGDAKGISRDEREELWWKLENQKDLFGYHYLLPAFDQKLTSLEDYLPKNLPLILVDQQKMRDEIEESIRLDEQEYEESQKLIFPPSDFRSVPEFVFSPNSHSISTNISADGINYQCLGFEDLRHRLTKAKSFGPLSEILGEARDQGLKSFLIFKNERKMRNLQENFQESFPNIEWKLSNLFGGFSSKTLKQLVITERDLFGTRRRRTSTGSRISASQFLREFGDLQSGDYVVHDDHGIGRYRGLIHLKVGQIESEFVLIEYADQDKLYLPIYRVDKISRYVHGDGYAHPKLDRLGSQAFSKRKTKAKKDIFQIAHELIEIAAQRKLIDISRPKVDEEAFQDFCQGFTFDLTPDQDSAIRDSLDDLQKNYPMDRLVCGDVGFGKTEVALRVAMFRLLQGVQVAVLAPTTLLAEQHYRQFSKRFEKTGFRVGRLSRFASTAEQKKTLDELKNGRLDLVIGTHRLLQKDIEFKNLGLLVVDEEQRFGVKHKEKIKKLRANVDILTLSATPIPRTLQMSIVGIRELSLIVTPPETREAVSTYVGAFEDKLIKEKALRELNRGGQIFFVHNRVKSIQSLAEKLAEILPDIKIAVAHGQMKEDELEKIMIDFTEKKYDLLLATSIIENGLDIPNANTLFVDHSEHFGLSDLYQLRGRVGRSHRKAYSYFLIREETVLTPEASKRLQVIQSCTELGSGFRVATHDLEIRGAGNLLGEAQSGVIAEIGLELYNQMLHETLDEIRSGEHTKVELPEVRPGYSAFIPESYIPDAGVRISTYRRLNQLQSLDDLNNFEDELLDRFGLYPKEVEYLCRIGKLRILAAKLKTREMDCAPGKMLLDLKPDTPLEPMQVLKKLGSQVHFDPKGRLALQFESALQNPDLVRSSKFEDPESYDLNTSQMLLQKLVELLSDPKL